MEYFWKLYQPSEDISDNKYISPILEDDMSVYPRTFIVSAECDVLLSEQLEFSQNPKVAVIQQCQLTKL